MAGRAAGGGWGRAVLSSCRGDCHLVLSLAFTAQPAHFAGEEAEAQGLRFPRPCVYAKPDPQPCARVRVCARVCVFPGGSPIITLPCASQCLKISPSPPPTWLRSWPRSLGRPCRRPLEQGGTVTLVLGTPISAGLTDRKTRRAGRLRAVDLEGPLPDGQLLCPERRLGEIMFAQQDKVRKESHSGLCVPDAVV